MIKRYVLGFCFLADGQCFLILKDKPAWQRGLFNGIGGSIEEDETPRAAMVREFYEESGIETHEKHWVRLLTIGDAEWKMDVFRGVLNCDSYITDSFSAHATDEGIVSLFPRGELPHNLEQTARWLYWLCLDNSYPDFFISGGK